MALVKYNNNSLSAITEASSLPTGAMTLIKEQTASSSSTISFVDGTSDVVLDSTYPIYVFKFINIHPATDSVYLQFNGSIDAGSNYNVTKTTTFFRAAHDEAGSTTVFGYDAAEDIAQGTGFQGLNVSIGNDNDQCGVGTLHLFNPSSTTFVKHFIFRGANPNAGDYMVDASVAGYFNTTSAVDAIQFKMVSGNIDAGTIKLYGIKDS
jgi:hypothetical protein